MFAYKSIGVHYLLLILFCRKLRKRDASKFHAQLCIAIFCMLFFFLVGIERTEHASLCTIMSLLIHYFTLAAVFWMGAEAILMFQKLIIVFGRISTTHIIVVSLTCWCKFYIYMALLNTTPTTCKDSYRQWVVCVLSSLQSLPQKLRCWGTYADEVLELKLYSWIIFWCWVLYSCNYVCGLGFYRQDKITT